MDFNADHFSLFGLPKVFRIDGDALDRSYREIQTQIHPDRFANADEAAQRRSLQWTTKTNKAYQTLRHPLSRARYLLGLLGHDFSVENNTKMSVAFLSEQMAWREAVSDARTAGDVACLEDQEARVRVQIRQTYEALALDLDEWHDYLSAEDKVLRLMYLEKLLADIGEALAALGQ